MATTYPFAKKIVATHDQIQTKISEIAKSIKADYSGLVSEDQPLVLICVLKGSYIFTADLARHLSDIGVPTVVEFICVSSYGASTKSSGEVRVLLDLRGSIRGRHCMLVEDIVDSARTLKFLTAMYKQRSPASLKMVTMLDKPAGRVYEFHPDYSCFTIENEFVVGYGLDYNEIFRDLRDIVVLKEEVYNPSAAKANTEIQPVNTKSKL